MPDMSYLIVPTCHLTTATRVLKLPVFSAFARTTVRVDKDNCVDYVNDIIAAREFDRNVLGLFERRLFHPQP